MTSARASAMRSPDRFMARGLAEEVGDENPRHDGPTGRANARPMTGSGKQSIRREAGLDCFVACAPRNDGGAFTTAAATVNATATAAEAAAGAAARAMRR